MREFDDLDEAVAAMRERALAIRAEGPVKAVRSLRDFEPRGQVHARLQLSGGGLLRKPVAGVDVRGDGTFVPYRGGVGARSSTRAATRRRSTSVRETLEAETDERGQRPRSPRAATPPGGG